MDIKKEIQKREELVDQLVKSGIPMDDAIRKLNREIADLQDELNNYAPSTPSELIAFLKENVRSGDWMEIGWGDKVDIGGLQYEHVFTKGGGEGDGEEYYVVVHFLNPDCYVRVDGWYASYDGGYLDGEPYLVQPEQKVITVYEKRI